MARRVHPSASHSRPDPRCMTDDLSIPSLHAAYRSGNLTPRALVASLRERIAASDPRIWISLTSEARLESVLSVLEKSSPDSLPLYGIPFAIKDNIDLASAATTAACPDFAFHPDKDATVVDRLISAGAIPMGKTNLDQFATGLVGVRSPYGTPENPFHPDFIPGGSSSGSAVAVARDLVSFSLGTDTAGSGRVPAGLNELIGLKPSLGLLSTKGVVPACRSLDCVSLFTKSAAEAATVLGVAAGFDPDDPYSRPQGESRWWRADDFTFGVPREDQLEFFGNDEAAALFAEALVRLESIGGRRVEIDFAPFLEAALLLYEGPWVAERFAAIEDFLRDHPESLHPVTRAIIEKGGDPRAVDGFRAQYRDSLGRALENMDPDRLQTLGIEFQNARSRERAGLLKEIVPIFAWFSHDGTRGWVASAAARGPRHIFFTRLKVGEASSDLPEVEALSVVALEINER